MRANKHLGLKSWIIYEVWEYSKISVHCKHLFSQILVSKGFIRKKNAVRGTLYQRKKLIKGLQNIVAIREDVKVIKGQYNKVLVYSLYFKY